jgi:hypothetical protein
VSTFDSPSSADGRSGLLDGMADSGDTALTTVTEALQGTPRSAKPSASWSR